VRIERDAADRQKLMIIDVPNEELARGVYLNPIESQIVPETPAETKALGVGQDGEFV
jgi:hypothetical protein